MKYAEVPALDPLRLALLQSLADAGSALGLSEASVRVAGLLGREVAVDALRTVIADLFSRHLVGGMDPSRPVGYERWFCTHGGRDALRAYGRALRGPAPRWSASAVADAMFAASRGGHELSGDVVMRMLDAAGQPEESADRREVVRCRTVADAAEVFTRDALRHPSLIQNAFVDRPPKGAKATANEAFVEHLKVVHDLRTLIARTKPLRLVASEGGC